jgi:hypothetical protein
MAKSLPNGAARLTVRWYFSVTGFRLTVVHGSQSLTGLLAISGAC